MLLPVVAAPILKLCPLYFPGSMPHWRSADFRASTKNVLVKGDPSLRVNSGPGTLVRIARYASIAITGQSWFLVEPR